MKTKSVILYTIAAVTLLSGTTNCKQKPNAPIATNESTMQAPTPADTTLSPFPDRDSESDSVSEYEFSIDSAAVFGDMRTYTIKKSAHSDGGGTCYLEVDYPICDSDILKRYLLQYIITELDSFNLAGHTPYRLSDLSIQAIDTLVGTCAWQMAKLLDEEVKGLEEDFGGPFPMLCGLRQLDLKMVSCTPKCVGYLASYQEFTGGAHGAYLFTPTIIRRSDGKCFTDIFKPEVEDSMQPILWKYLLESTGGTESDKESYREMVENYLETSHLPLPDKGGWIAHDGLHLHYQPYEIGNWAMGAPDFVIPADKARPFVSDEVAALME